MNKSNSKRTGFTIVELLVVIVVIGILAAITIVSYTGISQKAIVASIQSDLSGASNRLKMYYVENGQYPQGVNYTTGCPTTPVDDEYCLKSSSGNTFSNYSSTTPYQTFTLDATNTNTTKYRITNDSAPVAVTGSVATSQGPLSPGTMADVATGVVDSYGESYDDGNTGEIYGSWTQGQSFSNINSVILDSAKFYAKKYAATTGNCRVKIYAHTGTYGTSGIPTGSVLATSDDIDASTLSTSKTLVTFNFSGANRITLSASTYYFLVIEMPTAVDYSHGISIGEDRTSPIAGGNFTLSSNSGSTWTASNTIDAPFYVYSTVGTVAWTNPNNAQVSDGVYATANLSYYLTSHYLKATNFGFSIPSGATINGIVVEIQKKSNYNILGSFSTSDSRVSIVKADGTIGTTNKANANRWSTTEAYTSYSSSSDLWGETWDNTKINDVDFGVVISALDQGIDGGTTASVDHIRITVYYTTP